MVVVKVFITTSLKEEEKNWKKFLTMGTRDNTIKAVYYKQYNGKKDFQFTISKEYFFDVIETIYGKRIKPNTYEYIGLDNLGQKQSLTQAMFDRYFKELKLLRKEKLDKIGGVKNKKNLVYKKEIRNAIKLVMRQDINYIKENLHKGLTLYFFNDGNSCDFGSDTSHRLQVNRMDGMYGNVKNRTDVKYVLEEKLRSL